MSERAEHTAGPWKRSDYGQIVAPDGKDVCFRSVTTMCSGSEESIAESEANTDLIAAAPDLLAALIRAREAVNAIVLSTHSVSFDADLRAIDAAISKATGEA